MQFRYRAFLYHLSLSAVAASIALLLVFIFWYPYPLAEAVGATNIFLILLGVDVVLGPLLTLLVAKEGKKSLKFDLGVIVIIQLAAFIYGMSVMAAGRPVWIVFTKDRFDLVQAHEIEKNNIGAADKKFQQESWFGPQWAAARLPQNPEQRNNLIFEPMAGAADISYRPDLYVDYNSEIETIKRRAFNLSELNKYNDVADVEKVLKKWPEADAYLPLMSRKQELTVLIDKQRGKVIAIVPLKPW